MPPPPTFDVRLARARMLSVNVRELDFERVDGTPFDFVAGQWVSLVLPLSEGEARRAYSIASPPDGTPHLAIAVTKVAEGAGSSFLHALPEGAVVRVIGPQGFFTRPKRHPALFIGTGTGITPLRSIILDALARGDDSPMTLVVGVRHEDDRLYRDELEALAAKHPNFRVAYSLSQPRDDWQGLRGYVQTHVERELRALGTETAHVYICGLERMVGAVRDVLRKQMGLPRQQVHSERYD